MLKRAKAALDVHDYGTALDLATKAIQLEPQSAQGQVLRGSALFNLKEYEKSVEAYKKAAELQPDLPVVWKGVHDAAECGHDTEALCLALKNLTRISRSKGNIARSQQFMLRLAQTEAVLLQKREAFLTYVGLLRHLDEDDTVSEELPSKLQLQAIAISIIPPNDGCRDEFDNLLAGFIHGLAARISNADQDFLGDDTKCDWEAIARETSNFLLRRAEKASSTSTENEHAMSLRDLHSLCRTCISVPYKMLLTPREILLESLVDEEPGINKKELVGLWEQVAQQVPASLWGKVHAAEEARTKGDIEHSLQLLADALRLRSTSALAWVALSKALLDPSSRKQSPEKAMEAIEKGRDCLSSRERATGTSTSRMFPLVCDGIMVPSELRLELLLLEFKANALMGKMDIDTSQLHAAMLEISQGSPNGFTALKKEVVQTAISFKHFALAKAVLKIMRSEASIPAENAFVISHSALLLLHSSISTSNSSVSSAISQAKDLAEKAVELNPLDGEAHLILAQTYWYLESGGHMQTSDGNSDKYQYRTDRKYCYTQLIHATKQIPRNSSCYQWLGKWYLEVAGDFVRAEKCYEKALSLFPSSRSIAEALQQTYYAHEMSLSDSKGLSGEHDTLVAQSAIRAIREKVISIWRQLSETARGGTDPLVWTHMGQWQLSQASPSNDDIITDKEQEAERKRNSLFSASQSFQNALRLDDSVVSAWAGLGKTYHLLGMFVAASKAFGRAIELMENSKNFELPQVYSEIASLEVELQLFDESINHIKRSMNIASDSSLQEDCPQHTALSSKALAEALYLKSNFLGSGGAMLLATDALREARDAVEEAIRTSPALCLYKLLGDISSSLFRWCRSNSAEFQAVLRSETPIAFVARGVTAYEQVRNLLQSESKTQSLSDNSEHRQLLASASFDLGLNWFYQWQLAQQGRDREESGHARAKAAEAFRAALEIDPLHAPSWNGLGLTAAVEGEEVGLSRRKRSQGYLVQQYCVVRAIQLANSPEAWVNLSVLYLKWRKWDLAKQALLSLQAVDPANPVAWIGQSVLATVSHRRHEVRAALKYALELELHPEALLGLAEDSLRQNNHPAAAYLLDKYLVRDADRSPWAWNSRGLTAQRQGQHTRALSCFACAEKMLFSMQECHEEKVSVALNKLGSFVALRLENKAEKAWEELQNMASAGELSEKMNRIMPLAEAQVTLLRNEGAKTAKKSVPRGLIQMLMESAQRSSAYVSDAQEPTSLSCALLALALRLSEDGGKALTERLQTEDADLQAILKCLASSRKAVCCAAGLCCQHGAYALAKKFLAFDDGKDSGAPTERDLMLSICVDIASGGDQKICKRSIMKAIHLFPASSVPWRLFLSLQLDARTEGTESNSSYLSLTSSPFTLSHATAVSEFASLLDMARLFSLRASEDDLPSTKSNEGNEGVTENGFSMTETQLEDSVRVAATVLQANVATVVTRKEVRAIENAEQTSQGTGSTRVACLSPGLLYASKALHLNPFSIACQNVFAHSLLEEADVASTLHLPQNPLTSTERSAVLSRVARALKGADGRAKESKNRLAVIREELLGLMSQAGGVQNSGNSSELTLLWQKAAQELFTSALELRDASAKANEEQKARENDAEKAVAFALTYQQNTENAGLQLGPFAAHLQEAIIKLSFKKEKLAVRAADAALACFDSPPMSKLSYPVWAAKFVKGIALIASGKGKQGEALLREEVLLEAPEGWRPNIVTQMEKALESANAKKK